MGDATKSQRRASLLTPLPTSLIVLLPRIKSPESQCQSKERPQLSNSPKLPTRTRRRKCTTTSDLLAPISTTREGATRREKTRKRPRNDECDSCHHQPSTPVDPLRFCASRCIYREPGRCLTEFMLCQLVS